LGEVVAPGLADFERHGVGQKFEGPGGKRIADIKPAELALFDFPGIAGNLRRRVAGRGPI